MRHSPGLSGIRVDLRSEAQLREAFEGLNERLAPMSANTFVVQRMATPGVSCVVRTDEDPLFGPVVVVQHRRATRPSCSATSGTASRR